jgi:hypothetical protein
MNLAADCIGPSSQPLQTRDVLDTVLALGIVGFAE